VGHGVGGITKPGSLVVFDRQGATHDVKEVSPHPVAP
jgi:hypothetical protein